MTGVIIVAGSRGCGVADRFLDNFLTELKGQFPDTNWRGVFHGACPNSPDMDGDRWAKARGLASRPFPADWDKFGKVAGMLRNAQMAQAAANYRSALFAVWNGKSPGTANMIANASSRGLYIKTVQVSPGR